MENGNILPNLVPKDEFTNLLSEKERFRMSPIKARDSVIMRKSIKPLSSSQFKQKKPMQTKEDLAKINSKLEMIKSKVMKLPKSVSRSDNFQGQFLLNQQFDDSVDEDEGEPVQKLTKVHLLRSKFQDRPSTIFFFYPKCCGLQSKSQRVYSLQKATAYYKIAGSQYKCIVNTLEFNGFQKLQSGSDWNIFFDVSGIYHQKALQNANKYQKINHFPGCWQLGRKDYMWKNLTKQRRAHPQAYNFVPTTYIFPGDFDRFQIARQNAPKDQLWIMKPTNQACGRGIKMVTKETQLKKKKDTLVSEYIANPHLINNFKYDLRIYVLVSSYDPLRIYLFNEGLVRFATYQYNTKAKDVKKRFIHLTNFSVNKHSKKFVKNKKAQQDGQGSKWSLTALKTFFQKNQINSKAIFDGIKDIIIKTCISAEPLMLDLHSKTQEKRNCGFEIYGFDILIDSKLKPWLMEVNVCPSLSSSSPMDRKIKYTLLTDTLNLLGLQYYSRKGFEKEKKKEKLRFQQRQDKKLFSRNINNLQNLNYNNCIELLSPDDWLVLFQSCQELERQGNFQRIFPLRHNLDTYKPLFEFSRYNNSILWKYLKSDQNFIDKLYI